MGRCHICKANTNYYCVDHDKHICLQCLSEHHKECTIGDYAECVDGKVEKDPNCHICNEEMYEGDETIRLPCLHRIHRECFMKQLNSVQLPETDNFAEIVKCSQCQTDIFTEEHKEHQMMKEMKDHLTEQMKQNELLKKYFNIEEEETTEISFHVDEDNVVGTQSIGKKESEMQQQEEKKQEHVNIEFEMEDDKKPLVKDMDGEMVLNKKFTFTLRTKILIIVLIICFIFLLNAIFNQ